MTRTRRRISPELKAKIALEALEGKYSVADIADHYSVHPNQVYLWKRQLRDRAASAFDPVLAHLERSARPR